MELPAATGERRSLTEFKGRPVYLSFLGAATCAFCRAHVIRIVQARDAFAALDVRVVLVAYHDPQLVMTNLMRDLELPYLLLLDTTRQAYAHWGLGQFSVRSLLSPGFYLEALRIMSRREPKMPRLPNMNQLGGDFVIDANGRLALANRMRSLHDRAPIPDLLAAPKRCLSHP